MKKPYIAPNEITSLSLLQEVRRFVLCVRDRKRPDMAVRTALDHLYLIEVFLRSLVELPPDA